MLATGGVQDEKPIGEGLGCWSILPCRVNPEQSVNAVMVRDVAGKLSIAFDSQREPLL